jgi:lysophospholipase L1-like esterase
MRYRVNPPLLALTCALAWALIGASLPVIAAPIAASDPHVARMGRSEIGTDGSVRFGYPGVSFYLDFTGTQLSADADASGARSYLDVIVDGGEARKMHLAAGKQSLVLASTTQGKHRVEIVNRSETWHGVVKLLRFDTDGEWQPAPTLPSRKLLVLGDSITCGEAIDRVAGEKKAPAWWNARASYGMLMAHELNAQVQLVCYGGRGLIRTWDNKTNDMNLIDYYRLAVADKQQPAPWDQADYQPDLIISAIGTNDMAPGIPDRERYVAAYVKLVQTILKDHPHAQVALTEGGILTGEKQAALTGYIADTVRLVGDRRVHAIGSTGYPGDATDGHPTREQHVMMANDLLPQVRAIMHWPD